MWRTLNVTCHLGAAHRPMAFRNTLRAFRRAAMDLAPSMLLSDNKNVLLWLPMGQGLDEWPRVRRPWWRQVLLGDPGKEQCHAGGHHESGAWLTEPTSPPQGEMSCMALCFCSLLWCSTYSCTPQGGADKSLSSVLSLAPRRNMLRVPCESFRV